MWELANRAKKSLAQATLLGLCLTSASCTGILDSSGAGDAPAIGAGGGSGASASGAKEPGRKLMHRLNSTEYNATVADVLGTALAPATATWRGGEIDGFDNIAAVLGIDDQQYERYLNAAETLAKDVFASEALRARFVTCTATDDAACVSGIIGQAGLRLFRRPLADAELVTYRGVYDAARAQGEPHEGAVQLVLQALLSSAEFLYRIELDSGASGKPTPLGPYELASRMSYFLWSSAPDDALLEAAASGALAKDATLASHLDRMLADSKANRFVMSFAGQWLGARSVLTKAVSAELYPSWNAQIAGAAAIEMYEYFNEFLRQDRPWRDFLRADVNYVDGPLAGIYGMPAPAAPGTHRIEYGADARAGFFGLVGFLAVSSVDRRTAPTLRGRWILINLLCTHPAPPPPDVPLLEAGGKDTSKLNVREVLEEHRRDPRCAACHAVLDPMGLALEEYDAIGQYRSQYPDGSAIDPSTEMNGVPFSGLSGLTETVSANPSFNSCIAEKLYTYGLGRSIVETDRPYLQAIEQAWLEDDQSPTIRRLLRALMLSEPFRYRSGGAK